MSVKPNEREREREREGERERHQPSLAPELHGNLLTRLTDLFSPGLKIPCQHPQIQLTLAILARTHTDTHMKGESAMPGTDYHCDKRFLKRLMSCCLGRTGV